MAKPITPDLMYRLTGVSSPELSFDGRRLAYVKSWVDGESLEERSRVQMMELPQGEDMPFTQGAHDSSPKFSPDEKSLAFLRQDDEKRKQVWLMGTEGGEARTLTRMPGGVTEFAWSPDSRGIAFCSDVDPDRPPDDHDPKKDPRVRVVSRIRYRQDTIGWRGDAHRHLFIADVEDGSVRQITDGDWDDSAPAWSPDGRRIAFISGRRDDRDLWALNETYVVSVDGGEPEQWSDGLCTVAALGWSPDGSKLAAVASNLPEGSAVYQGWVYILEPGQVPHRLTDDTIKPAIGFPPLGPVTRLHWTEDGRIFFIADRWGETFLYWVSAEGGQAHRIAGGGCQMTAVAFDSRPQEAVVVSVSPWSHSDLYLIDMENGSLRQLTRYNAGYFEEHPPAQMQKFSIQRGGMEIESRIFLPPDFDQARQYPMVLEIHGGPNGAFYDAFSPIHQVLATAGYIVLAVNPRGSSTYGSDFTMAVLGDWGGEDYQDILASVEHMVSEPYVDQSRLGLHGYSYGGYMTSWIIGHTNRFRAAVVGAPCTNLSSLYGTSDIGVSFGERQWGGMRKDNLDEFIKRSPLTYAPNVTTPVLLLHGEADYRCPIEQSEQYFVALKRLGKEAEFVRFPDSAHSFVRAGHPKLREEYLARMLGWFDRHLKGAAGPEAADEGSKAANV